MFIGNCLLLPKTIDTLKYDGHYVALPWAIDIRVWYYRKDLFGESDVRPPTTWQEFKAAAQALNKPSGDQYGLWLVAIHSAHIICIH
jgi:ABC-type glycerol-3-phosphate transport system substrate-binding protein